MSLLFALIVASSNTLYEIPDLPEPVANNAVAKVTVSTEEESKQVYFLSFMGLGKGKSHSDVHDKVFALKLAKNLSDSQWQQKKNVPSSLSLTGRLASTAVGIGADAYLFGGYTVAEDHTEISSPDVFKYEVTSDTYTRLASMPVPVDDSVALSYQDRYIYLVSGWHNDGNVNLTQVYDIETDSWFQASPFLGKAVFGQAGAISDNVMVVCDGVETVANPNRRRSFGDVAQCLKGTIDKNNPAKVDWRTIPHPTADAHYRMAAASYKGAIYMIGGSNNPYNYDGMGYDGKPAPASSHVWRFDVSNNQWQIIQPSKTSTMDHRGLLEHNGILYRIGGMDAQQNVMGKVIGYSLKE
ncbi:galactose oxidase [Psychrosphaera ytuae]|uniref:Galactose oxidase n=1 Tax=Psychrosphaera ytuae TaxID=2820710 RepID=A0A975DCP1_9GAMM|nr:kelch repeat-containing protein [Psychrosphaera ytuae]QTH64519.1 galactose oxidase [Psychrosphaera ytuae]